MWIVNVREPRSRVRERADVLIRLGQIVENRLSLRRELVMPHREAARQALPEANRYCSIVGCKARLVYRWQRKCGPHQREQAAAARARSLAKTIGVASVSAETKAALEIAARADGVSLSAYVACVLEAIVQVRQESAGEASA